MTTNPEQQVLDAIDELVDWQLEEGQRRGDGPTGTALVSLEPLHAVTRQLQEHMPAIQRTYSELAGYLVELAEALRPDGAGPR